MLHNDALSICIVLLLSVLHENVYRPSLTTGKMDQLLLPFIMPFEQSSSLDSNARESMLNEFIVFCKSLCAVVPI